MFSISHVCYACQNLYEAAARLRDTTGLDTYDGGWFANGLANRIMPLGNNQYIEVESLIDRNMAKGSALWFAGETDKRGDALLGWLIRVETKAELDSVGRRLGKEPQFMSFPQNRMRPDGSKIEAFVVPPTPETWPRGLPNFVFWPDLSRHPDRIAAAHRVKPQGIAWVETGGSEAEIREWLGPEGEKLPVRFVGGEPGLRAVAVATATGEIVFRP
jgi:hypothetical protein